MYKRACLLLPLFLGVIACGPPPPVEQVDPVPILSPLHGAWRGLDIQTVTAAGEITRVDMQENLLLFTEAYYTIAYSSGDERFPIYAERWAATDEEKVARDGFHRRKRRNLRLDCLDAGHAAAVRYHPPGSSTAGANMSTKYRVLR